jgi:hypothetical protein
MIHNKKKSKEDISLNPFPNFVLIKSNKISIQQSNHNQYTQKTFYDISQKKMETDTDKAKRRLKILFNHHGKYYGYF